MTPEPSRRVDSPCAQCQGAYAIDRLMPVLHNIKNEGQSWRENGVSLEKVLTVNAAIGKALPEVWEHLQAMIYEAGKSGVFEKSKTAP